MDNFLNLIKTIFSKKKYKLVDCYRDFEGMDTFTGVVKDRNNTIVYYVNGKLHREDGPAVEWFNGDKDWYLNGKLHREDGPAIESVTSNKLWYLNGKLHREDGPAIECDNGDRAWWLNGELYGENDDFTNDSWIRLVKLELLK